MSERKGFLSGAVAVRHIMRVKKCSRREAEALFWQAIKDGKLTAFDPASKRPLAADGLPDPEWPQ